jgi:SAM-dependent methyltransferase
MDPDLLTTPLFIIKELQRNCLKSAAGSLTGRLLDIGCGTQPFRRYLSCSEYIGIDETENVSPLICASVLSIPFKDGFFDSAICTEVLEHTAQPRDAVAEIARVLKSGGRLYVTVPQSWGIHYEPHDYWRFTKYGIDELLREAGMAVVSVNRVGGIFSLIGQQAVDVLAAALKGIFAFLGPRPAERISSGLVLPLSIFFYCLGKAGDRVETRHALGWAVMAVKR